jgi:exodeoxyribonuclease VII large subunit
VLQDAEGHVVTSVAGISAGQPVSVRVADGRIHATASTTEPDPDAGPDDTTEETHG